MAKSDTENSKVTLKELRRFGWLMGVVLALIGGFLLWKEKNHSEYFFLAGGVFIICGLAAPRWLGPVHQVWMGLAYILGWVMTHLILSVLFYLIVTPIGLIGRVCRKRFLNLKFPEKEVSTFWIAKSNMARDQQDYEKQY